MDNTKEEVLDSRTVLNRCTVKMVSSKFNYINMIPKKVKLETIRQLNRLK